MPLLGALVIKDVVDLLAGLAQSAETIAALPVDRKLGHVLDLVTGVAPLSRHSKSLLD
jgi:hypothetical protein